MEKSIHTREHDAFLRLLKKAREDAELTQVDLAAALKKSQSFVSKVERGETRLDIIQLRTVLTALGVTLSDFANTLEQELAAGGATGR